LLNVSCIQLNSSDNLSHNIDVVRRYSFQAINEGADLLCFPENVLLMSSSKENLLNNSEIEKNNKGLVFFRELAIKTGKWISIGSLSIITDNDKLVNRSYLINSEGNIVGSYDKIHLFDVMLSKNLFYKESDTYASGNSAVLINTPIASFGLTICYDIRFPQLYRDLAISGANIILVPSAFTKVTGEKHWHILLRSRAIETGCYIIAAAQTGKHSKSRETYGHSLIVDPDGVILKDAGEKPGIISLNLDFDKVEKFRKKIPSLYLNPSYKLKII